MHKPGARNDLNDFGGLALFLFRELKSDELVKRLGGLVDLFLGSLLGVDIDADHLVVHIQAVLLSLLDKLILVLLLSVQDLLTGLHDLFLSGDIQRMRLGNACLVIRVASSGCSHGSVVEEEDRVVFTRTVDESVERGCPYECAEKRRTQSVTLWSRQIYQGAEPQSQ